MSSLEKYPQVWSSFPGSAFPHTIWLYFFQIKPADSILPNYLSIRFIGAVGNKISLKTKSRLGRHFGRNNGMESTKPHRGNPFEKVMPVAF